MATSEPFVTPEAVVLERDIAGLGTRFIGGLVDGVIQTGLLLVAGAAAGAVGSDAAVILWTVTVFTAVFVYPTVMEAATRGRTLGKMAARTRVVLHDGRPVTFAAVLVRNLLRLLDVLPGVYAIGAISILVTRRAQRLGDLAAGTVVVYEAPARAPQPLVLAPSDEAEAARRGMDATGLTAAEYELVRSFLLRRDSLDPEARARLAEELRTRLRERVGTADPDASAEAFLEAVAASYRERFGP
jgi:uncharacterized RDD family membrane protein YckC